MSQYEVQAPGIRMISPPRPRKNSMHEESDRTCCDCCDGFDCCECSIFCLLAVLTCGFVSRLAGRDHTKSVSRTGKVGPSYGCGVRPVINPSYGHGVRSVIDPYHGHCMPPVIDPSYRHGVRPEFPSTLYQQSQEIHFTQQMTYPMPYGQSITPDVEWTGRPYDEVVGDEEDGESLMFDEAMRVPPNTPTGDYFQEIEPVDLAELEDYGLDGDGQLDEEFPENLDEEAPEDGH